MSISVSAVLQQIKNDFEFAVTSATFNGRSYPNGAKAKEALIRSQRIINYLHEFIKSELMRCGVNSQRLHPPPNSSGPEVPIPGFLKAKKQDICVIPEDVRVRVGQKSRSYERIITVNIRSQLSSMAKNKDTLFERTFAEALNLHLEYPRQCLGEVYVIPTYEYDDKSMVNNRVKFKSTAAVENYVRWFQTINNRRTISRDEYKYERVCLLVADFRESPPRVYSRISELVAEGIVPTGSDVTLDRLTVDDFAKDLLDTYDERFDIAGFH